MSRTTLCIVTAGALVAVSSGFMVVRHVALGDELNSPSGPGTWKVRMLARGKFTGPDARLVTTLPQNFGRQRVLNESFRSDELHPKPPDIKHPERRHVTWTLRPEKSPGPFQAHLEFVATVDAHQPTSPMTKHEEAMRGPPGPGEHLDMNSTAGTDHEPISNRARLLTAGVESPLEQAEALFRFVDEEITTEPSLDGPALGAAECLEHGSGDTTAKARLLVALLRNRGIPARIITGLTLTKGHEQLAHHWVEAWISDRWFPMCPVYHHFGRVPATFLVFTIGDTSMVRGRNIRDLDYAFLVEKGPGLDTSNDPSAVRRFLRVMSFHSLPPDEQQLVGFLLMLPVAALMVCVYRNVIGLHSFGTFAPALIGLAFRELCSVPGLLLFVCILLVGWLIRRVLDHYHLLQVPRQAFMLSLVVLILIGAMFVANSRSSTSATTQYVSLFPLVILTGMIERFWTLEQEDSTAASFRTLLGTIVIAASIGFFAAVPIVARHLFRYPETLGMVMAGQLLLGRYTGYRLSELIRFRDFVRPRIASVE